MCWCGAVKHNKGTFALGTIWERVGWVTLIQVKTFVSVFHLQPNQISMDENILVSRYINNPLLIDGEFFFAT